MPSPVCTRLDDAQPDLATKGQEYTDLRQDYDEQRDHECVLCQQGQRA
jgi:hypothetical protein